MVVVITRTKNRPLLLERAIKSIVAQTYKDYVLVIVNDGGTKKPVEDLVKKYRATLAGRVQIIHNQQSLGMEEASNKAIKQSNSKYIAMHDDDDSWEPDFLKTAVEHLEAGQAKGVVTAADVIFEEIDGDSIKTIKRQQLSPEITTINYFHLLGTGQFPNNAFVYAREALAKVGDYDPSVPVLGDWEFAIRFMGHYDIDFIPKSLANYHRRPEQTGKFGNSIFTDAEANRHTKSRLINKLLRQDLAKGQVGVGTLAAISEKMFANSKLSYELLNKTENLQKRVANLENELARLNRNVDSLAPPLDVRLRRKLKRSQE